MTDRFYLTRVCSFFMILLRNKFRTGLWRSYLDRMPLQASPLCSRKPYGLMVSLHNPTLSTSIWQRLAFHLYAVIGHRERRFGLWWSRLQTGLSANVITPSMNPLQLALKYRSHKVGSVMFLPATCTPPRTRASERGKRTRRPVLHRTFSVALLSLACVIC